MNRAEAIALALELHAQNAPSRGTRAICYVQRSRIVFDRLEQPAGGTAHSLDWSCSDRERVLAHWAGYIDAPATAGGSSRFVEVATAAANARPGGAGDPLTLSQAARAAEERPS